MTQTQARGEIRLTVPTRDGNGWSRSWTRIVAGVLYSFVAVVMPITGELRFTASRSRRELPERPLFGADWERVHSITIKAEAHGALTWSRTRPGLYIGARRGEAQFEVIRDPNAGRDNTWCVRLAGTTNTITAHRLLKTAQRVAERYTGKRDAEALLARLAAQADATYGECTGARDEQTLGRPRAHAGTVGTYRFTSGAADARLCHAHGDAYGDLATRVADDPATPPAAGSNHYTRDGMSAGCGEMYSTDTLTSDGLRVNCERCLAIMAAARDVRRGNTDDLPERAAEQGFDLVVVPGRMPIELRSGGVLRMNFADRDMCRQWLADAAAVTIARHNQLADEITEYRAHMGSWPALQQLIGAGWSTEVVLAAAAAGVIEVHDKRYATTPAGYVAAFYREHRGWPTLSQVVQLGADLDVVQLAIEAGRLEHREIADVRMLMLPVPNPQQPIVVDDVVTVAPDRQSRQYDVISVDDIDGELVRVHPRRMLTTEDGPRWVSRSYTMRVPPVLVLPGDADDDDQGDGGTDPQPDGPTGCPAGPACSGAAFPGHDAHPVPGQQPGAIAKCEHGFMVEGNIETCPNGCPQQRIGVLDVAARAADRAGRAYAELLASHADATRTSNTERAAMLADSLPLIRQGAIEAGADVPAIEREHGPGPVEPTVRARCWHGSTVDMRPLGWWHQGPGTRCDDPGPLVDELYGRTEVVITRPNGDTATFAVGQRVTLGAGSGVFVIESFETRGGVTPAPYAVLVADGVPAARAGAFVEYLVPVPEIEIVERPKLDAAGLVAARCTAGDYQSSPMTEARARRAGDAHLLDKHGIGEPARTVADMLMPAMPDEYRRVLSHLLAPFGFAAPEGIDKLVPSDANPEAFLVHDPTGIALGVHDRFVRLSYPAEHAGEGDGHIGEAFADLAYGTSFETVADLAIGLTQRLMRETHLGHMRHVADELREIADQPSEGSAVLAARLVLVPRRRLRDLGDQLAPEGTECAAAAYARRVTAVMHAVMVKLVDLAQRGENVDPDLLRSLVLVAGEAMTAPTPDVEQLVEHLKRGADAAIVADETVTPADVDALIDTLVDAGWLPAGDPEYIGGKRLRYLVPPTGVEARIADVVPLPRAAERHQAPAGVPFVSCKLHGADCRSAQNGRPCSGMPAPAEPEGDGLLRFEDHMIGSPEGELVDVGGYLVCGCHGSQREHTCDVYAEPPVAPEE